MSQPSLRDPRKKTRNCCLAKQRHGTRSQDHRHRARGQDGSAIFKVPPLRSISFNLLDKDGKLLMRMG